MKNLSVLIVEDGKSDFLYLRAHIDKISDWNTQVYRAESFAEAKELISSVKVDICLLDYYMDNITADSFLEEIQLIREFLPVVLVSGRDEKDLKQLAEELKVDDYICKSDISVTLLERILKYCVFNNRERLAAQNEKQKYMSLFNTSLEAIFTADEDYKIIRANKSFKELIKADVHEGLDFRELFLDQNHEDYFSALAHDAKRNIKRAKLINSNGEKLEVYVAVSRILHEYDDAAFQVVIHDITEFERMQNKLYENEKIDLIQRMARIIGHEVRNPLTNILLATGELRHDLSDDEDTLVLLDMIHRNSTRISSLIDKFLKNSKNTEISKHETIIEKVVLESFENCKDRILLKQIDYSLNGFDQETPVQLDSEKMQIVLTNIIINAVEALESVENPYLKLSLRKAENSIDILISDNGIGMTEEIKKNLFSPFYTSKQGGLGLGMVNAKNIVEEHGAQIGVRSELNGGTDFIISIPH